MTKPGDIFRLKIAYNTRRATFKKGDLLETIRRLTDEECIKLANKLKVSYNEGVPVWEVRVGGAKDYWYISDSDNPGILEKVNNARSLTSSTPSSLFATAEATKNE